MDDVRCLTDNREWKGNDLETLRQLLEQIEQSTSLDKVNTADIEFLSLKKGVMTTPGHMPFRRYNPFMGEMPGVALPLETTENRQRLEPLLKELKKNCLMIKHGDDKYFTADSLIPTLALRIGAGGTNSKRPSFKRDAYFTELLGYVEQDVKLLSRKVGDVKKAFALHSEKYTYVPQTMILDIIDHISHGLGTPVCRWWKVSNAKTEVYLEFPEKAKDFSLRYRLPKTMVPGLHLITSDVAESSLCAIGTWRLKRAPLGTEVYARKHTGRIDPDNVLEQISRKIFAKYDKIPQRLCELMMIEVADVMDAVESVFEQINLADVLGKRRMKELLTIMEQQFNAAGKHTAYDVATTIMMLPDMIEGLPASVQQRFADCVSKAVFADYKEYETPLVAIPA